MARDGSDVNVVGGGRSSNWSVGSGRSSNWSLSRVGIKRPISTRLKRLDNCLVPVSFSNSIIYVDILLWPACDRSSPRSQPARRRKLL